MTGRKLKRVGEFAGMEIFEDPDMQPDQFKIVTQPCTHVVFGRTEPGVIVTCARCGQQLHLE